MWKWDGDGNICFRMANDLDKARGGGGLNTVCK